MIRLALLLAGAMSLAHAATTLTIIVNNGTTFLDGSSLNGGTTYYAAFELTGGDASNSTALVTGIALGGGSAVALNLSDTFGSFTVGPNGSDPAGAFQNALMAAPGLRIAGGTDEILRNIIAERVLGLPGDVRVDKDVPFKDIPTSAAR